MEKTKAFFALVEAIQGRIQAGEPLLVAIDGPCATGKTTLGGQVAEHFGCPLFHMDDFFLQPHQRTPERLSEAGGNVDRERFFAQVLLPLTRGEEIRYQPWHCRTASLGDWVAVPPTKLAVVEGAYALHPELRDHYHLRVFLTADDALRRQRILERNGAECLKRFEAVWIPLENTYFDGCQVEDCCHLVL